MYTATMRYSFKEENFEKGCAAWKNTVLTKAAKMPGLIRMQFLVAKPTALAIGTWKNKKFAEAFMQTGVFKDLMAEIESMLVSHPVPEQWELLFTCSGD